MESIFGLPAHPLFVHAPVVLMPLAALGAVALAVRPAWRRHYGPAMAVAAAAVMVATFMAVSSGEAFEELAGGAVNVDEHESLAETARNFVILFFLGAVGTVVLDRFRRDNRPAWADQAAWGLSGLTLVFGVVATVWMFRTGHEGARLVWDGVIVP